MFLSIMQRPRLRRIPLAGLTKAVIALLFLVPLAFICSQRHSHTLSLEQKVLRDSERAPLPRGDTIDMFKVKLMPTSSSSSTKLKQSKMVAMEDPGVVSMLSFSIDMSLLHKQRLKPWTDIMILGGDTCPGPNSRPSRHVSADSEKAQSGAITWYSNYNALRNEDQFQCPKLVPCHGSLPNVHFCKMKQYKELRPIPITPPINLQGQMWTSPYITFQSTTLPWEGTLVSITSGCFLNHLGHVFNTKMQYLHGGCQDIVDANHGGQRFYSHHSSNCTVTRFKRVALPRFYLMSTLLQKSPFLNIVVHSRSPIHLLKLIGLDPQSFRFHFLGQENELVYASEQMMFPLAPRCLHVSRTLWKRIRTDLSTNLKHRLDSVPLDFNLPLNFADYLKQWKRTLNGHDASFSSLSEMMDNNLSRMDYPLLKVVYISRLNLSPRRHLLNEEKLLAAICDRLQLRHSFEGYVTSSLRSSLAEYGFYVEQPLHMNEKVITYHSDPDKSSTMDGNAPMISLTRLFGNETMSTVIQALAGATLVIAPHGAALANIIFLPARASVWELATGGYWNPCFMYLTHALTIKHGLIRSRGNETSSFELDEQDINELVSNLGETLEYRWDSWKTISLV